MVHPILPMMVPEFDEREASAAALIPWDRWDALDRQSRIGIVAWHRGRRMLETHGADAASEWMRTHRG